MDDRTPVLLAAVARTQREDQSTALEAAALMASCAADALEQAGVRGRQVGWVGVPDGMTTYRDPARLVADRVGAARARTVLAKVGVQQNTLLAAGLREVQAGRVGYALVCGGEAHRRTVVAERNGAHAPVTTQYPLVRPDDVLPSPAAWQLPQEADAGLVAPGYYALVESALRAADGESLQDNRSRIGEAYALMAATARTNPHATRPVELTAREVREPGPGNPMIAFPYTRHVVSSWTVDQASALLLTTAGRARADGLAAERVLYPLVSVEANLSVPMPARSDLTHSSVVPLLRRIGLAVSGHDPADADLVDLYSCFPVAMELAARGLGVPDGHERTVGGGMPFAGGPLNNAVLQATVRAWERVGEGGGRTALVTCVSGDWTKQGFTLWSADSPVEPYAAVDATAAAAPREGVLPVAATQDGPASVVGCTVLHRDGDPWRSVAVVEGVDRVRSIAWTEAPDVAASMMDQEWVGRRVNVAGTRLRA